MTKSQKIAHMTAMLRKNCDDNIHECADILQGMAIAIFGYYAGQLGGKTRLPSPSPRPRRQHALGRVNPANWKS